MFIQSFSTLISLLGLASGANFGSYERVNTTTHQVIEEIGADDYNLTSYYFAFNQRSITESGSGNIHGRYNISYQSANNQYTTLGYIEFYFDSPSDTSLRIKPHVETHFNQTCNLQVGFLWTCTYDQMVSVKWSYENLFDFSTEQYFNYSWTWEEYTSSFTANYDHDCELVIVLIPMNEEQYNSQQTLYYKGYSEGQEYGYSQGQLTGYQQGYTDGYNEGVTFDSNTATIFSGIIDVGLLPVNVFLQMLNLEIFGINIAGFVMGLLSVAIIFILFKTFIGKGGDK